jgi:putative methionine-R-sulfoxide reductase with GAF domain
MSKKSSLDRDSFQQLLASAYAVQESQMDSRFLTAMLAVQRSIMRGEIGTDSVVNLIADSARDVAGAAGVAIGLLEGNELVFRAASGCSVPRIGSRVSASLTSSAKTNREILRVEDAQTDARIEGAICRQFGALSLLILPISSNRAVAGVLEIQFSEPHAFKDYEVQTYRLMTALIETAIRRGSHGEREERLRVEQSVFPRTVEEVPARGESYLNKINKNAAIFFSAGRNSIRQRCSVALTALRGSTAVREAASFGTATVQRATEVISHKPLRSVAFAAVAVGLGLTFWIAHGGRRPASPLGSSLGTSAPSGSATVSSSEPRNPIELDGTSHAKPSPVAAKPAGPARTRARRVRAGQNSIEYIGNDVTVRHFNYRAPPQRASSRVSYVGDDVTVRYFTPKSALSSVSR